MVVDEVVDEGEEERLVRFFFAGGADARGAAWRVCERESQSLLLGERDEAGVRAEEPIGKGQRVGLREGGRGEEEREQRRTPGELQDTAQGERGRQGVS